jgi:hypothetical protein
MENFTADFMQRLEQRKNNFEVVNADKIIKKPQSWGYPLCMEI